MCENRVAFTVDGHDDQHNEEAEHRQDESHDRKSRETTKMLTETLLV